MTVPVCRISPPGDFCTSSFSHAPECHTFPVCSIGRSMAVTVMVRSLPRLASIPRLPCLDLHKDGEQENGAQQAAYVPPKCTVSSEDIWHDPEQQRQQQLSDKQSPCAVQTAQPQPAVQTQPLPNISNLLHLAQQRHRETPSPTQDLTHQQHNKTPQERGALSFQKSNEFGAISKCKTHKSAPLDYFDKHAMSAPELDTISQPGEKKNVQSTSPKVIITKKSIAGQNNLDLDMPTWGSPSYLSVISKDNTDSDTSSPDIDKFLNKTLGSKPELMTPQEMETYLSRLCISRSHTKQASPTEQLTPGEQKVWQPKSTDNSHTCTLLKTVSGAVDVEFTSKADQTCAKSPNRVASPKSWLTLKLEHKDKVKFSLGPDNDETKEWEQQLQKEQQGTTNAVSTTCVQNGHAPLSPESPIAVHDRTASSPSNSYCPPTATFKLHKSISVPAGLTPGSMAPALTGVGRASSLLKSVMRRDATQQLEVTPCLRLLFSMIHTLLWEHLSVYCCVTVVVSHLLPTVPK